MPPSAQKEVITQSPKPEGEVVTGAVIDTANRQPDMLKKIQEGGIPEATAPAHMEGEQKSDEAYAHFINDILKANDTHGSKIGEAGYAGMRSLDEPLPEKTSLTSKLKELGQIFWRTFVTWRQSSRIQLTSEQPLELMEKYAKEHGSDYAKDKDAHAPPKVETPPVTAPALPPAPTAPEGKLVQFPTPQPQNVTEISNQPQSGQQQKAA